MVDDRYCADLPIQEVRPRFLSCYLWERGRVQSLLERFVEGFVRWFVSALRVALNVFLETAANQQIDFLHGPAPAFKVRRKRGGVLTSLAFCELHGWEIVYAQ